MLRRLDLEILKHEKTTVHSDLPITYRPHHPHILFWFATTSLQCNGLSNDVLLLERQQFFGGLRRSRHKDFLI